MTESDEEFLKRIARSLASSTASDADILYLLTLAHRGAQIAQLREALKPFAEHAEGYHRTDSDETWARPLRLGVYRRARAALEAGDET